MEVRAFKEGDDKIIEGIGIPYNKRSQKLYGCMYEIIARGACTKSLGQDDIYLYLGHDNNKVLARNKSGTLKLEDREEGVFFRAKLGNSTLGNDTYDSVSRGDLTYNSFGFIVNEEEWDYNDECDVRTVTNMTIKEISLVTTPAYLDTNVYARSTVNEHEEAHKRMLEKRNQIIVERNKMLRDKLSLISFDDS